MVKNNNVIEQEKFKNSWAIIGFVLALISVFFAYIGIIPLAGVVTNIVGLYKAKTLGGRGKLLAIAGLIISLIYTLVYLNHYGYISIT